MPDELLSSETARGSKWISTAEFAKLYPDKQWTPEQIKTAKLYSGRAISFNSTDFGVVRIGSSGRSQWWATLQKEQRALNMHRSKMLDVICKDGVSL
jgi:hypothetical protein